MMTPEQLAALRESARQQYRAAIEAAQSQYQEAIQAIEAIAEIVKSQRPSVATHRASKVQLVEAVKQAVNEADDVFDLREVVNRVRHGRPELATTLQNTSVSTTLRRLEEDGLIEIVSRGVGTRPTTYRRTANVAVS